MRLKDKIAIVTGGASGFGKGIAERFAQEGASVVVADLNGDAAEQVAEAIRSEGGAAKPVTADVTRGDEVKAMVEAAVSGFGGLDIVVNNAGMPQRNQPMLDVDEETFDRIFEVNCKSLYLAAVHAVPVLRARGGGVMINTASTAGLIALVDRHLKDPLPGDRYVAVITGRKS